MGKTRTYQRAFVGGEMSPEMFGRIDDARFQVGAARMRNMIVKPQGAAFRRPWLEFVREVRTSAAATRLIPFQYSTDQTMVLEFGSGYIRFHTSGATLSSGTPQAFIGTGIVTITQANPGVVTWNVAGGNPTNHNFANGDKVIFATTGTLPGGANLVAGNTYYVVNTNTSAGTFSIAATSGGAALDLSGGAAQSGAHSCKRYWDARDLISYDGSNWYCLTANSDAGTGGATNPDASGNWYEQGADGEYQIPTTYAAADLFEIHYVQSNDVLTLVHPGYPPKELRRYGATEWEFASISFAPAISTPTVSSVTEYRGAAQTIVSVGGTSGNPMELTYQSAHGLVTGDVVRVEGFTWTVGSPVPDGYYVVVWTSSSMATNVHSIRAVTTGVTVDVPGSGSYTASSGKSYYADLSSETSQYYRVTALNSAGQESSPSAESGDYYATNNLTVNGSYNDVAWGAVTGASRYRVYKKLNGLYGLIGETDATTFRDDNIGPDLGISPPTHDASLSSTEYPGAVGYFEQRRCFAGTSSYPQDVWMTRSGTESDLAYTIPTQDSDRIYFRISDLENSTIRHMVPLDHLLLFTSGAEYRVSPVNDDVMTPDNVSVRPQSYIGANEVKPIVVNNTTVFCAARGGHVREMGYKSDANGFVTGDLSLRAAHLFDDKTLVDSAYQRSPLPILWFVSSTGYLLGLTYVPEEAIGAWHWHDTDGEFESVCVVAEGDEDRVYVVVKRSINGSDVRYIERMGTMAAPAAIEDASFVDSGIHETAATAKAIWLHLDHLVGESVQVLGDGYVLADETVDEITETVTFTHGTDVVNWTAHPLIDGDVVSFTNAGGDVPAELAVSTDYYVVSAAADTFQLAATSSGSAITFTDDGTGTTTIHCGYGVELGEDVSEVSIGLPYTSQVHTIPISAQIDGFATGHTKNVNQVWVRVTDTGDFDVGWDTTDLAPAGLPDGELSTEKVQVVVHPGWNDDGQLYIQQAEPLPLTVVGLTIEASIGGS